MLTHARMIFIVGTLVAALGGCGGGDHSAGSPSTAGNAAEEAPPAPPSSASDFSSYAQLLASNYTCDTNPPVETNDIDFTFIAAADMAEPVGTGNDSAACKV